MSRNSCTKIAKMMIEQSERFVGVASPKLETLILDGDQKKLTAWLRDCCEAYGHDVRCYVSAASPEMRRTLEKELRRIGLKPSTSYWPGSSSTEFGVSYFKAWHWNE